MPKTALDLMEAPHTELWEVAVLDPNTGMEDIVRCYEVVFDNFIEVSRYGCPGTAWIPRKKWEEETADFQRECAPTGATRALLVTNVTSHPYSYLGHYEDRNSLELFFSRYLRAKVLEVIRDRD